MAIIMEGVSALTASSSSARLPSRSFFFASAKPLSSVGLKSRSRISEVCVRSSVSREAEATESSSAAPKLDKSGRFCSPRAARELALSVLYASCLQGCDPVRLLQNRLNGGPRDSDFDNACLPQYDHMSFGGPPVTVHSVHDRDQLLRGDQDRSRIEAEVLAAPPKLVYSKLILRLANKFLVAVTQSWDAHVNAIGKIAPPIWKDEAGSRILELCILHLAMSEISVLQTRHQIVINEAVDLAKRFCDGAAPRIINGCLRTFVRQLELEQTPTHQKH